jgi:hypothetical protein
MAAFRDIELHIQTCPGMDRDGIDDRFKIYNTIYNFIIPDELFEQGTGAAWRNTKVIKYNSKYFFLMQQMDHNHTYEAEVVMLGTQADCKKYDIDIAIIDSTNKRSLRVVDHPSPVSRADWGDSCLIRVRRAKLLKAGAWVEQKKEYNLEFNVIISKV